MRHALRTTAAVVAVAALGACRGDDGNAARAKEPAANEAAGSTAAVTVRTFQFQPDPITVTAGTTITFTNDDRILHTVTAGTRSAPTPDRFGGKLDGAGSHLEVRLDERGRYPYFCSIHPGAGMTGEIVVEPR